MKNYSFSAWLENHLAALAPVQSQPQVPATNFMAYANTFKQAPHYIQPDLIDRLVANPRDQHAMNAIMARDYYAGAQLKYFLLHGTQMPDNDSSTYDSGGYGRWGG